MTQIPLLGREQGVIQDCHEAKVNSLSNALRLTANRPLVCLSRRHRVLNMRGGIYRVDFKSGRPAGDGIAVIGFPGVMEPNPELGITFHCYWQPYFRVAIIGCHLKDKGNKVSQHLLEKFSVITEEIDPGSTANAVGVS